MVLINLLKMSMITKLSVVPNNILRIENGFGSIATKCIYSFCICKTYIYDFFRCNLCVFTEKNSIYKLFMSIFRIYRKILYLQLFCCCNFCVSTEKSCIIVLAVHVLLSTKHNNPYQKIA